MLLPGHIALGYLLSKSAMYSLSFSPEKGALGIVIGTISAIAPDLDLVYFFLKKRSLKLQDDSSHRTLMSHAPLTWLLLSGFIAVLGNSELSRAIGIAILVGSWSHFIGDSLEYGIMWLWPFSKKQFSLRKISEKGPEERKLTSFYWKYFWTIYIKNWTFWIELVVIIAALLIYIH